MNIRPMCIAVAIACVAAGPAGAAPTSLWIKPATHYCASAPDDTIRVEVMLNSINDPIDNAGVGFYYDQPQLVWVRAERGALIQAWSAFSAVEAAGPTPSTKQVTIDASNATPIPAGISGHFATLVFVVQCVANQDVNMSICVAQAYNDFLNIVTYCGPVKIFGPQAGKLVVEWAQHACGSALGDTVEVDVSIDEAARAIGAAGLDIPYDALRLEYVGYRRGALTAAWPFFDAADVMDRIRVGGFSPTPIAEGASGVFVTLRFVAHCCDGGFSSVLNPVGLVDDFADFQTHSGGVGCTALATRQSTWGHVKSLYR